jgi:DNA gyrase subunit B
MPAIVQRGYLYIAQPPLFKVKRGQSETYLKDEAALESYLCEAALAGLALNAGGGHVRRGADLADLVAKARALRPSLQTLGQRIGHRAVTEQAALAGAFNEKILNDDALGANVAKTIAGRLNAREIERERVWKGEFTKAGGYAIARTLRGVTESVRIAPDHIRSVEAVRIHNALAWLKDNFAQEATLEEDSKAIAKIAGPTSLYDAVQAIGRKGLTIQRYKGLGEMNPEQLWETTLDPTVRTLLQVNIRDAQKADEIFSTLMGDIVEPRKKFIQDNALKATNIDA